jgi:hypothetical protein
VKYVKYGVCNNLSGQKRRFGYLYSSEEEFMTTTSDILMEASSLEAGERTRITCITCGGSGRTLTISRMDDGVIVWNCYRASCEERGANGGGRLVRTRETPRQQTIKPYTRSLERCDDASEEFLLDAIGWEEDHVEMARPLWAADDLRYAFPIYGPTGIRRGYVLRSYAEHATTKALTYMESAEPHMSWYRHNGPTSDVVVVEDIPSAVRVARYANALALCGTGCGPDYANEIAAHVQNVTWALDADATSLAIKLHRKHSLLFYGSRVMPLPCDVKDMDEADVAARFGGNNE